MAPSATTHVFDAPLASGPTKAASFTRLSHAPKASLLQTTTKAPLCNVSRVSIPVSDHAGGSVPGFLHLPSTYDASHPSPSSRTAAILLSGAGGGVVGPSSIYLSLADKLASLPAEHGIPTLRLDYRSPARNEACVADVYAAMAHLEKTYNLSRFVLVGWSFGGAPVFTVGGTDRRVVGCATVASQTAETEGIRSLAPTPVLLLHGTGDRTLSPSCSEKLYSMYGSKGEKELKLFEGDDHALTRNAREAERLIGEFIMKCAGVEVGDTDEKVVTSEVVGDGERVELMKKGGDLRDPEKLE